MITARNYLEVYVYEQWSNRTVPQFQLHERFPPTALELVPGATTAPDMLSEADLITLMDKNGIGTFRPETPWGTRRRASNDLTVARCSFRLRWRWCVLLL